MKMCKLGLAIVIAAMTMFTSCLGDSENSQTVTSPGVFCFHNMTTMIETSYGYIYAPELMTQYYGYSVGDYVAVSFTVDRNAPQNTDATRDYLTVTINGIESIDAGQVYAQTDTTKVLENEFALQEGLVLSNTYPLFAYFPSGVMFLTSGYSTLNGQKNNFQLSFDPTQEPVVSTDGNGNIYTMFIRSTITSVGKSPSTNVATTQGYNVKSMMDMVDSREKAKGNAKFQLQVYFVSDIKDNTTPVWTAVDTKILCLVTE